MIIASFLIGLSLITALGWLVVRILEADQPALYPLERVCMGIVAGTVASSFGWFLLNLISLPLNRWTMLLMIMIPIGALGYVAYQKNPLVVSVDGETGSLSSEMTDGC